MHFIQRNLQFTSFLFSKVEPWYIRLEWMLNKPQSEQVANTKQVAHSKPVAHTEYPISEPVTYTKQVAHSKPVAHTE